MPTVVWTVFLLGLVTALATGLGALPFLLVRRITAATIARANAAASGLMLGASFSLIAEGSRHGGWQTMAGGLLGALFILGGERLLSDREVQLGDLRGLDARKALLLLAVMTLHSFSEGVAVGVAFGGGERLAVLITAAIAVHNVPEGLAISATLRPRGASIAACAAWSVFSSLPQPLMAVPAFLFVDLARAVLPYGLGFAAGAMVFMVLQELLPESYQDLSASETGLWVSLTLMGMVLFQTLS